MLFVVRSIGFVLFFGYFSPCSTGTPPRGSRKEMHQGMNAGVRALSFDSDEEDSANQYESPSRRPAIPPRSGLFSGDDDDEGRGVSSSGTSSGTSGHSSIYQQVRSLKLSDVESDDDSSLGRGHISATSGLGSDSPSIDQSDSDRSRLFADRSINEEEEEGGTLVGVDSPKLRRMHGGTPTLALGHGQSRLYNRQGWKKPASPVQQPFALSPEGAQSLEYSSGSFDDFSSPPRNGPLGSDSVASLEELYHSPASGFNLDKNLWPPEYRQYVKIARPPPVPGTRDFGVMAVKSREVPPEFLRAVEFGRQHHNQPLSSMKWKKAFISGNSAIVYGVEIDGKNYVLKIVKHGNLAGSHNDETPQCVEEADIRSLHRSSSPCFHQPKNGLVRERGCSSEAHLVPFEYYIAEKVARMHGLLPGAASLANSFGRDSDVWYLIFDELAGVSPLKYGENILERLAKPLIRQQLEALHKMATCHIMHLDAHWGNILYSRERGIQLIDFGIATLVNRFELPDFKATLIITFTLDRCLDCEASRLGRDFQKLVREGSYPISGHALLDHPWLQYEEV